MCANVKDMMQKLEPLGDDSFRRNVAVSKGALVHDKAEGVQMVWIVGGLACAHDVLDVVRGEEVCKAIECERVWMGCGADEETKRAVLDKGGTIGEHSTTIDLGFAGVCLLEGEFEHAERAGDDAVRRGVHGATSMVHGGGGDVACGENHRTIGRFYPKASVADTLCRECGRVGAGVMHGCCGTAAGGWMRGLGDCAGRQSGGRAGRRAGRQVVGLRAVV